MTKTEVYPSPELVAASDAYDLAIEQCVDAMLSEDKAAINQVLDEVKTAYERLEAALANSKEPTP